MSLVEVPFLAVGHLLRRIVEIAGWRTPDADGYSLTELWSVAVGIQLLFGVGLTVLYRLVSAEYGQLAAVLGVFSCWLGTSLFHYSAVFPFMAHALSFTLLVLILYGTRGLATDGSANRRLAWLGLLLGILFLVRPQQVVVAIFLLPLFVSVFRTRPVATWWIGGCVGLTFGIAAVAAQVAFNYAQFGSLTLSGYAVGGEGFSWLSPQMSVVLFSRSKGLFVFSPVVALAILGYALFPRSVPSYLWPAIGNAFAQVYLIAAWTDPRQGDAFGARMWSDNTAVVAFGVALAFHQSQRLGRSILTVATVLATCWTAYLLGNYIGLYPLAVLLP